MGLSNVSRLEQWKYMLGLDNVYDRRMQEEYNRKIGEIETISATTILQLKDQLMDFWHAARKMRNYEACKLAYKDRKTSRLIYKIFFACLGLVLRIVYGASKLNFGKDLRERSQETFAEIGGFEFKGKTYRVLAFRPLKEGKDFAIDRAFTQVMVFEKTGDAPHFKAWTTPKAYHFGVTLCRNEQSPSCKLSYEGKDGHGKKPVLERTRRLLLDPLPFGFHEDRVLNQRLIQMMIEMAVQNKVLGIRATSSKGNVEAFLFNGFKVGGESILYFDVNDLQRRSISYSKDGRTNVETNWWSIMIENPILQPGAAVLPEYWVKKPLYVR